MSGWKIIYWYLNDILILFPLTVGIVRFKKLSNALVLVWFFVAYGTFNEIFIRVLYRTGIMKNNLPFSHLYGIVIFVLLGIFYGIILKGFINKRVIHSIIVIYSIYYLINSFFIQNIHEFPSIARAIGSLILILFSIFFFIKVMFEANITKLADEPLIWINTALLVYFSGNLFFYVLFNIILQYSKEFSLITTFYLSGLNFLMYFAIAIGFLKAHKKTI